MSESKKPAPKSALAAQEFEKVDEQMESFDSKIKSMTLDEMNKAPKLEEEPQTKIASRDMDKMKDIYLKPTRVIMSPEKFNEKWREEYNFAKQCVHFIAENKEIPGEDIKIWRKPFPGCPAEEWTIPVNKPIWAPRYVAEGIKSCNYHQLSMDDSKPTGSDQMGKYHGSFVVDKTVQRLDAIPVSTKKSIFMGAEF